MKYRVVVEVDEDGVFVAEDIILRQLAAPNRRISVPDHPEIGTLGAIHRHGGITVEEFVASP